MFEKITIIKAEKPITNDINANLLWLGGSLGLFSSRDKDKSCFRIFIALLKALRKNESLSSDQLAEMTGLTRGTVVHHLNHLIASDMVISDDKGYRLKEERLSDLVVRIKRDLNEVLDSLREVAAKLDEEMGLHGNKYGNK